MIDKKIISVYYDNKLFVDRTKELTIIQKIIERVIRRQKVDARTIRISGERGVGKTWLLLHLHHLHRHKLEPLQVTSFYIDFDREADDRKEESKKNEYKVREFNAKGLLELLKKVSEAVKAFVANDALLPEQSDWLAHALKKQDRVMVWLLDGLFDVPEEFLELLETYFLNRIIEEDQQVIIMSGRGRAPLFTHPNLNTWYEELPLGPLPRGKVADDEEEGLFDLFEKIGILNEPGIKTTAKQEYYEKIYRISGGYPRTALLLVQGKDIKESVKTAVQELLAFIKDKKEREQIQEYLESLVLLNRWQIDLNIEWGIKDPDGLYFINAYKFFYKHKLEEQNLENAGIETFYEEFTENITEFYDKPAFWRIRNKLQDYQLLRWEVKTITIDGKEKEYQGYFVEEAIRYPLAYDIKVNKPALWQWLHYVGWKLFDAWAKRYGKKYGPIALAHQMAWTSQKESP